MPYDILSFLVGFQVKHLEPLLFLEYLCGQLLSERFKVAVLAVGDAGVRVLLHHVQDRDQDVLAQLIVHF